MRPLPRLNPVAERYADKRYTGDRVTRREIADAQQANTKRRYAYPAPAAASCAVVAAGCLLHYSMDAAAAVWAARAVINDARGEGESDLLRAERSHQASLLRDIFGNPFRPVSFDPSWRTDTAVSLAKHMYDSRDFSATPILGDALQDAGCDDPDILTHCRDEHAAHARGCWVIDQVLGRE